MGFVVRKGFSFCYANLSAGVSSCMRDTVPDASRCREKPLKFLYQRRQVSVHDVPYDVVINRIVPMDQPVAETDNLRPGDIRASRTSFLRNTSRRLTEDLEQANQAKLHKPVAFEIGTLSTCRNMNGFPRMS